MKVFLDDVRSPPNGWLLVSTPAEVIALLKTGEVTEISLDHDLGDDENIGTGYDVLLWIEREVVVNNFVPPAIRIHTSNPPAKERMLKAVKSINEKV